MSSSGGIGGGANRGIPEGIANTSADAVLVGKARISPNGQAVVSGRPVDLGTAAGAAALRGAVDAEGLATVKGLLQLKEVQTAEGPVLVPEDSFRRVDIAALYRELGPRSSTNVGTELNAEIGALFVRNGMANPWHADTTPALEASMRNNPRFRTMVESLTGYIANPSKAGLTAFQGNMARLASDSVNTQEILFLVFKESMKENNEDKKYFLQKMQMLNDMGEELSTYLSELVKASRDLGAAAAGAKYPEMAMTAQPIEIKKFDLSTTDAEGKLRFTSKSKPLDRAGLNDIIKEMESMQEAVRNRRQMASTAFRSFDQKTNQLYNLLSSVIKLMNEMRAGVVRSML